ncbi:MAG: cytochrome c biogenesis protein CcsA [Dehalococcoidia bacterium]|nr:cytochrome c biogenesis protein CcsA [Dehalococcoidia bacterium]MDZ4247209.1 cytochrome c biogenesis protein CcsA [Dehalococcoidia bacterium]
MNTNNILRNGLLILSFVLMTVSLYLVFVFVPTEREMGIVQRIFYLMVPTGWLALLSFVIIFIGSILYLVKRARKWDILAMSSAEIGIVFTTLALIVGSIWARPIWGVWWTWEPRLTATLVLWFIYLAYFMVRSLATDPERGARYSAIVGIIGLVDIPIIALSTTLWRGIHPGPVIFSGGLAPPMLLTLMVSLAAFTSFYFLLLQYKVSAKNDESLINTLRESIKSR